MSYYNNTSIATALDGGVNASIETWTVDDGSTYPAVPFPAKCELEVVHVTAKTGTNDVTWTVVRGFDGTTGATHATGIPVEHVVPAGHIAEALDELTHSSNRQGTPVIVDEFDDESFSGWTTVEDTSPNLTITEKFSKASLFHPGGDSAEEMHGIVQAFTPSGDFYLECAYRLMIPAQNYEVHGLVASTNATYGAGSQRWAGTTWSDGPAFNIRDMTNWNNQTATTVGTTLGSLDQNVQAPVWYERLFYDISATTWTSYLSPDGISWFTTVARVSALTTTYVGFAMSSWGSAYGRILTLEYFAAYNGAP